MQGDYHHNQLIYNNLARYEDTLNSGVYFYELRMGNYKSVKKLLMMK